MDPQLPTPEERHKVIIIGSGFGGTMTGLSLARALKERNKGETTLMLERGTWWTTPVGTVQDKEVKTYDFLRSKQQPVQFWSSMNDFRGFLDIFTRCLRRPGNIDGLYEIETLGKRPFLGLFGGENDGVTVVRASGVGGGSLVYSNITIRPPELIFADERWGAMTWSKSERDKYYDLAREAIGHGVLNALDNRAGVSPPAPPVNTGLSNIVTRSARLNPQWLVQADPNNSRGIKQIDRTKSAPNADHSNDLWIDRARVFQTAASQMTREFGTVDSAINDLPPEPALFDPGGSPKNYCERQGRCNVGCLPGARHTLNKQLMVAALGKPNTNPLFKDLSISPLCEVDYIEALSDGAYRIHYFQYAPDDSPRRGEKTKKTVIAEKLIVSAGCLGTNELLLRSKQRPDGLPDLSDRVGAGFSTNGDYIGFLEDIQEHVTLTRGPVTTSFAHMNIDDSGKKADEPRFHTIEDQGVPPAMASLVGIGVPLVRSLGKGHGPRIFVLWAVFRWIIRRLVQSVTALFKNAKDRQDFFKSTEELTGKMMCIVAQGRESGVGQFRLGRDSSETGLRVKRSDGKAFYDDPVYKDIETSLQDLADRLAPGSSKPRKFINPFLVDAAGAFNVTSVPSPHPLGGCRIGKDVTEGVVDEFGCVFRKNGSSTTDVYSGLYVADASIIPTALGLNPSLTISALSLRIADKIITTL